MVLVWYGIFFCFWESLYLFEDDVTDAKVGLGNHVTYMFLDLWNTVHRHSMSPLTILVHFELIILPNPLPHKAATMTFLLIHSIH